jgi:hypothetical protein
VRRVFPFPALAGALAGLAFLLATSPALAQGAAPLSDWTAIVVAGDWRAGGGRTTMAFDNGRRDIAHALVAAGFAPGNVLQFSLRPSWPGDDPALVSTDPRAPVRAFVAKARTASSGCLFYVTSHGAPSGAVFGPNLLMTPELLKQLISDACPSRPAVVVVSACFSGVFTARLKADDRMVMTAARRDRTSFGCGADDVHTYFDECMLSALPRADGFLALAPAVKACVAARENAEHMSPPSEPQVAIGAGFAAMAPFFPFARPQVSGAGSSPRSALGRPDAAPPADAPPARRRGTHSP